MSNIRHCHFFLTVIKFYNLGHIQGCINSNLIISSDLYVPSDLIFVSAEKIKTRIQQKICPNDMNKTLVMKISKNCHFLTSLPPKSAYITYEWSPSKNVPKRIGREKC